MNIADLRAQFGKGDDRSLGSQTIFDTAARALIGFLVFALPLFFLPVGGLSLEFSKSFFVAFVALIAFLLWIIGRLQDGSFSMPRSAVLLSFGAIALVAVISALFSDVRPVSIFGFFYEFGTAASFLALFVLLALTAVLFQSERRVLALYGALVASFAVVLVFQVIRIVAGNDTLSFGMFTNPAASIVGKWNDLALYTGVMALLALAALEFLKIETRIRYVIGGIFAVTLIVLAVVNFYLVWAMLGILALVLLVYHLSFKRFLQIKAERAWRFPVAATIVLVLAVAFVLAGSTLSSFIVPSLGINTIEVRPSWGTTIEVIQEVWREDPALGIGPNRFDRAWLFHKPDAVNYTPFWGTDFRWGFGLFPTLAATTGVAGLVAVLLFFAAFFFDGFRTLFLSRNQFSQYLSLSAFLVASLIWLAAFAYTPGITLIVYGVIFTGVCIALRISQGFGSNVSFSYLADPRIGFVSVLALVLLVIANVWGGYDAGKRALSLVQLEKGRSAFAAGSIDGAQRALGVAASLNPYDTLYRLLADVNLASVNSLLSRQGMSAEDLQIAFQSALGATIEAAQRAVRFDETNYLNWSSLSNIYAAIIPLRVTGAYENAAVSLEEARKRNPKNPALVLSRARLEALNGDNAKAREFIGEALALKNDYTDAIFLLAQIQVNEGKLKDAIRSVEQATLVQPNDAGLFFQLGLLKYNNEEYRGSASAFGRAVALIPEYSNARYFLGLSLYNLDDRAGALAEFQELVRLNPDNEEVNRIHANLKAGRRPLSGIPSEKPPEERPTPPIEE